MRTIILIAALSACAPTQRLGRFEAAMVSVLTASAMVAIACDYRQTMTFSNDGRWDVAAPNGGTYVERNPLLGTTPSTRVLMVDVVVGEGAVAAVALTRIPTWLKYTVLGATVLTEAIEVARAAPSSGVCGR